MRILIIDDDETKCIEIEKFIFDLDYLKLTLTKKQSWQSGFIEIKENGYNYDFLILDMSMPRYDSGIADSNEEFETYAGWEILKEMKRNKTEIPTCLFTQYDYFGEGPDAVDRDTIHLELVKEFPEFYKGVVFFKKTNLDWKDKLRKIIVGVLDENTNC